MHCLASGLNVNGSLGRDTTTIYLQAWPETRVITGRYRHVADGVPFRTGDAMAKVRSITSPAEINIDWGR